MTGERKRATSSRWCSEKVFRRCEGKAINYLSDFQSSDWQSAYRDLAVDGIEFELIKVGMNEESGGRYDNQAIIEAKSCASRYQSNSNLGSSSKLAG